jgi:hypothetical protein
MDTASGSRDHPADADLLERLLAREEDPHMAHCARCAARAETIAREIDPLRDESTPEPFDELFYRRQAARVRARIAAGEGRRPPLAALGGALRLAWVGGAAAAAAVVVLAVALHGRLPGSPGGGLAVGPIMVATASDFASAQDLTDDRLLREIDDILDEDL